MSNAGLLGSGHRHQSMNKNAQDTHIDRFEAHLRAARRKQQCLCNEI